MTTTRNDTKITDGEITYTNGDWFIHEQHGLCVLAADDVAAGLVFVCGDTYIDFVPLSEIYADTEINLVDDKLQFTKEQFDIITDGDSYLFEYVEEVSIGFKTGS